MLWRNSNAPCPNARYMVHSHTTIIDRGSNVRALLESVSGPRKKGTQLESQKGAASDYLRSSPPSFAF